jgi:hypothetical protein
MSEIVKSEEEELNPTSVLTNHIVKEGDKWIKLITRINKEIIENSSIEENKCYYQMYDNNEMNVHIDKKRYEIANKLNLKSIKDLFDDNKIKSIKVLYIFIEVSNRSTTIDEKN